MYKVVVIPLNGSLTAGFARMVSYLGSQTREWNRDSEVRFASGGVLTAELTTEDYNRMRRWLAGERSKGRLSDCEVVITSPTGRTLTVKEAKAVEKKNRAMPLFEVVA